MVGGAAVLLLVAAGVGGAWLLSSHHAPAPLALGSPTPAASPGGAGGTWKVTDGSEAGYRVREKLVNQSSTTEAVARTTKISGGLVVDSSGGVLTATALHFTADLSALVSQDRYAVFQTYQRDFFIRTVYLMTDQFPNADFTADKVTVPAAITSGPVSITVTGNLTVHGETKPVTTVVHVQLTGDQVEVAGSINIDMRDFNISVPDISFTKAEPGVVIEYRLLLTRA